MNNLTFKVLPYWCCSRQLPSRGGPVMLLYNLCPLHTFKSTGMFYVTAGVYVVC